MDPVKEALKGGFAAERVVVSRAHEVEGATDRRIVDPSALEETVLDLLSSDTIGHDAGGSAAGDDRFHCRDRARLERDMERQRQPFGLTRDEAPDHVASTGLNQVTADRFCKGDSVAVFTLIGGGHQQKLFVEDGASLDTGMLTDLVGERRVEFPALEGFQENEAELFDQAEEHSRHFFARVEQKVRAELQHDARRKTQRDGFRRVIGDGLQGSLQIVDLTQNFHRPFEQQPPRSRRHDATGMADQEIDTEVALELADLKSQRRLGNIQLIGGAREIADLDDFAEVFQLAQVDGILLRERCERDTSTASIAVSATSRYLGLSCVSQRTNRLKVASLTVTSQDGSAVPPSPAWQRIGC